MDLLQLKNFRCFEDTGKIPIKPLTFLVGSNSSGKSSFLKFFPLLKQSLDKNRHGMFLWTDHYVDFKDFQNTIRANSSDKDNIRQMEISFDLQKVNVIRRMRVRENIIDRIRLTITLSKDGEHYDKLKKLIIELPDQRIQCDFLDSGKATIQIGGVCSSNINEDIDCLFTNDLLPRFAFKKGSRMGNESNFCSEQLFSYEEKYNNRQNASRSLFPFYANVMPTKDEIKQLAAKRWNISINNEELENIFDLLYFLNINNIIDTININILSAARNIIYIGPLRKATERYYRFQNLAIDEIEPDGSNLAMYLYNLSISEVKSLNDWLSSIFDFTINVKSDGGHVELEVVEKDKKARNLVDVGFGYTQVLPILVNIWKCVKNNKVRKRMSAENEYIIAIEQPELHLHPRMQAKFAIMLANVINELEREQVDVRFVIETHSETILNKMGELISLRKLARNDVCIALFNARQEDMDKEVELAEYSEDGFLTNWPINFFEEDAY